MYNSSTCTTFILVILSCTLFERFKILNLNNFNLKQYFKRVNDFRWKTHEYQSCRNHQYIQLLFWSYFHLTKFGQLKFWISIIGNFKQDFETLNDFNNKSLNTKFVQHIKTYNTYICNKLGIQSFFIWGHVVSHLSKFDQVKFGQVKKQHFDSSIMNSKWLLDVAIEWMFK